MWAQSRSAGGVGVCQAAAAAAEEAAAAAATGFIV
jgi:hypothetical protein